MKTAKSCCINTLLAPVLALALLPFAAHATSATWTGSAADGNLWATSGNWNGSPVVVPGPGDTATFDNTATSAGIIDLGSGVTVKTIAFSGTTCPSYTLGTGAVDSQTLTFTNGGGFSGGSGYNASSYVTNNATIYLSTAAAYAFFPAAGPKNWIFNGKIAPAPALSSGTATVNINGLSQTFNGLLSDGAGGAKLALNAPNGLVATLKNNNNTFSGGINLPNAGVSVTSVRSNGIPSAAGAGGIIAFGSVFGPGNFTYTGKGDTSDRTFQLAHGWSGGKIDQSGTGLLKLTGDVTVPSQANNSGVGSPTLTLQGSTAGTGEITGVISDNGTTGQTALKAQVSSGATSLVLQSVDGIAVGASISGTGIASGTTITSVTPSTRTVTLSAATTGTIAQYALLTIPGVNNVTYVTKSGTGTWTLSGANTYSGVTLISGGILSLVNSLALQNSTLDAANSVNGSGTAGLRTTVTALTLGGLTGSKSLSTLFTTTSGGYNGVTALTLNPADFKTLSYTGAIADGAVGMSLTKIGAGTQILAGTNTYTGVTTISNGTLAINGSLAPSSAVTISGSGVLAGTGTIQGAVTNNGSIAPGGVGAVGKLMLANVLTGAGVINFDLTSPVAPGVAYDQINGGGTLQVVLSGPTMIQLNATTGTLTNGNYYLITNTASLTGGQFVLNNGLTSQTNGTTVLTLINSSTGLVLNVTDTASPTQLGFTSVPVNPQITVPFSVTVVAQDASGSPRVVTNDTTVTLSRTSGSGTLSGTLSGVISAGFSSVTLASLAYDTAETMTLAATATAGMSLTAASTNITFLTSPTQLAVTSVNGGVNPYAGASFNVVVQAQDGTGAARNVASDTAVSLAVNTGNSAYLNTPLTGTIPAGANSVTIANVIYSQPGTGISLTATRTSGDSLTAGNSAGFNVLANTNKSILTFTFPGYGDATIVGTNISITLPAGTAVTNLAPTYTLSATATGSPVSGAALNFTTPQTYIITAQDSSQQAYLVTVSLVSAANFFWANAVSDNWSSAVEWTNDFGWMGAPTNKGAAAYALNFNKAGTYTTTNDLNSGFLLSQLNFSGATATLVGNSLAFTNNSSVFPQINQNGSSAVTINNNLALTTNTTLGGFGSGAVVLNGVISGAGSLTKTNAGTLTFNNITNTYSGGTVINAGTVTFTAATTTSPFFGSGPVTINSPAILGLNRTYLTNSLTFNGGTVTSGNGFGSNLNGPVNLLSSPTFNITGGTLGIGGNVSGPAGFIFTGGSTLNLSGANSFTGAVMVNSGTVSVGSFNSVSGGTPTSNLGAPTSAAGGTISLGAGLTAGNVSYTGPGETTDRILQLSGTTGGATITQAGTAAGVPVTQAGQSGLLKFTSNLSVPGTAGADNRKTLTLTSTENSSGPGFVCGQGEIGGSIGDSVLGNAGQLATSVTKSGYGIWTLSGSNSYSGATTIQVGKLICTRAVALGSGPLIITDSDIASRLELDFVGLRQVASLTINGVVKPNGIYGSSSSIATTKDDTHFAGLGAVLVGPLTAATTSALALTSGANPSSGGASLTFTATVTGGNAPSGSMVFYDGLTVLGTNVLNGSAQASLTTSLLTGGTHSITALYLGNATNSPSASAALTQTVNDSRPATTTALALTAGSNPSSLGAAVTYTATVTGATPTGSVVFYNGTSAIGSSVLSAGQASLVVNNLPSGWNGISAQYLGDANNAPSTSVVTWQTVNPPAGNGKLKVFILAGQSNMQGKGQVEVGRDPNNLNGPSIVGGLGTLRNMLNNNPNQYGYLVDTNAYANTINTTVPGWRTMTNVWVSYFTSGSTASATEARKGYLDADFGDGSSQGRIGPEYGFGLVLGSQLGDPVLIIKTAWGGNSLAWNFRPPSSGTNNVTPVGINTLGDAYSNMVANVHYILNNLTNELTNFNYNPTNGYEIAGFGWHQGWNDIGEPEQQYETNLVNLIHDLRAEFRVPNLPVAIGITGMSSAGGNQLLICSAQAAVANPVLHPELAGTVVTVDTRPFDYGLLLGVNTQGYHWYFNGQSQFQIGQSMGLAMLQLLTAKAGVTNTPAGNISTNSAALNATVTWPFTPATGVVYWDTVDHGTNAGAWPNSAGVNFWNNSSATNQYGLPGDSILAGAPIVTLATTNLSFAATGLTPNTTYYYTYAATNQTVSDLALTNTQTLWATNVQSFTTVAQASPPPVPVLSASGVTIANGVPSFSFTAAAGGRYRLDYKNALTDALWNYGPWTTNTTSSAQSILLSDPGAAGQPQRYYRLEAAWP